MKSICETNGSTYQRRGDYELPNQPRNVFWYCNQRLTSAIKKVVCISSLSRTSRKPLTVLWRTMGSSAV